MEIIYLSLFNPNYNGNGVENKIYRQIEQFQKLGNISSFQYNKNMKHKFTSHLYIFNSKLNSSLLYMCQNTDVLYIRYFLSDHNFIKLLYKIKKINPKIKIVIEIPTYPYDMEFTKFSISLFYDKIYRKYLYKYVNQIITYSFDKSIYNTECINISNGVDLNTISIRQLIPNKNKKSIDIIFVAQIAFWHGYDRAISGLNNYYKNGGKENIVLHIVGDGNPKVMDELLKMVKKYNLNDHVIFYGRKFGNELDQIYNKCSLAMDSLGRHRANIYYNSTLKGKEYLAKGLPIISGVKTELDNYSDFKYYLRVPADDTPIDFFNIVNFYHNIYNVESEQNVVHKIRKFCADHFEFGHTFYPVIKHLKEN